MPCSNYDKDYTNIILGRKNKCDLTDIMIEWTETSKTEGPRDWMLDKVTKNFLFLKENYQNWPIF